MVEDDKNPLQVEYRISVLSYLRHLSLKLRHTFIHKVTQNNTDYNREKMMFNITHNLGDIKALISGLI